MAFFGLFSPWVELTVTTDGKQHFQSVSALEREGVPFREKTQSMGHNARRFGTLGALGEGAGASVLYYLYVKEKDLDQARHALRSSKEP